MLRDTQFFKFNALRQRQEIIASAGRSQSEHFNNACMMYWNDVLERNGIYIDLYIPTALHLRV